MKEENISDSEIRVIGGSPSQPKHLFPRRTVAVTMAVLAAIGLVAWLIWPKAEQDPEPEQIGVFEHQAATQPHPLNEWLTGLDTLTVCATATRDITVNDIPLRIYVPLNSTPHLEVGYGVLFREIGRAHV